MTMIKGLLVDLFGTIIPRPDRRRHDEFMDSISEILGMDTLSVREKWHGSYLRRIMGSDGTSRDFVSYFVSQFSVDDPEGKVDRINREWFEITDELMVFYQDVTPVLDGLKTQGVKSVLLTNCGANVPEIFKSKAIAKKFDSAIYSSEEMITKPDRDIFLKGCESIGLSPCNCAFIGDGDNDELLGSRDAGLLTIKIDRKEASGDYIIKPIPDWDPTVSDFYELFDILGIRNPSL